MWSQNSKSLVVEFALQQSRAADTVLGSELRETLANCEPRNVLPGKYVNAPSGASSRPSGSPTSELILHARSLHTPKPLLR